MPTVNFWDLLELVIKTMYLFPTSHLIGSDYVNLLHCLAQWFGDAEKLTKALFSFASKLAPVIIFVDEVRNCLAILISLLFRLFLGEILL